MWSQRLGAGSYLLALTVATNLWCVVMIGLHPLSLQAKHLPFDILAGCAGAVFGSAFFWLTRRRLHDLNFPGFLANVLAFPFFGVILLPFFMFTPAPRYDNRYGYSQPASGALKLIAAFASFLLAVLLVPYVTQLYA